MSFFDRFRKPKAAAPPPAAPPAVPARATIEAFAIVDAVGTLVLEGGERLRFGRSACKGFEPVVGAAVIVTEVASDARGHKAKSITLEAGDTRYDALLSARDAEHGLPSRTLSADGAAATARMLATITVLLRDDLPLGHQALRDWATARGLPRDGFDVALERDLELVMPGKRVLTYVGRAPFPADGLDAGVELGRAFLGLGVGVPGMEAGIRAIRGPARDPFVPLLCDLGRLVRVLAPAATGVILHRRAHLVLPIDAFTRALDERAAIGADAVAAWLAGD